jgi:RHS repeat-associated protein
VVEHPTPNNTRIADIPYSGSAVASSTLYYWRIALYDQGGLQSPYSTSSAFSLAPLTGTAQYVEIVQNTAFSYDAVGNITAIQDQNDTGTGKSVTYTYDTLYRLTNASTTNASTTPYALAYTYDILGNITTGDPGTYTYNTPGYANPHAATIIGGIPQYYDQNGNLASTTNRITNTWDYRNRLTESGTGTATTTFIYDHTYDRVLKNSIRYPNKFYNTDNSHTKHVFFPQGDLIATIIGTTASTTATTTYAHTDHLGGTSATTNTDGDVTELSDFYPYGTPRVSLNYTGSPEQRKYASTERDLETGMDYMQHRYYRADEGRFVTIDPVFYEVGITRDGKTVLMDPQLQNSYSYATNNPIIKKDPEGRLGFIAALSYFALGYGTFGLGTSIGHVLNTNLLFASTHSDPQREEAWALLAYNVASQVAGLKLDPLENVFTTLAPDALSELDKHRTAQTSISINIRNPIDYYTSGYQPTSIVYNLFGVTSAGKGGGGFTVSSYSGGGFTYSDGFSSVTLTPEILGSLGNDSPYINIIIQVAKQNNTPAPITPKNN